ncbi:MAG: hypothetical protein MZV49_06950 [Rhodopseudomonas palustris]|nr:hypothetical protein [Rhodopseudomonas palustris]
MLEPPAGDDRASTGSDIDGASGRSEIVRARHRRTCPRARQVFAAHDRRARTWSMGALHRRDTAEHRARDIERGLRALSHPGGAAQARRPAPCRGGEQQMLAIGRALMARPQAAAAGRAVPGPGPHRGGAACPTSSRSIRGAGTTIVLVEQNAFMALNMADYGYVLGGRARVPGGTGAGPAP